MLAGQEVTCSKSYGGRRAGPVDVPLARSYATQQCSGQRPVGAVHESGVCSYLRGGPFEQRKAAIFDCSGCDAPTSQAASPP